MNLFELRAAHQGGRLTKQQYIDEMHKVHECLFAYADFLRGTDVARIEITDGQIVMQSRERGIRMVCNKDDKRIIPIEILNFGSFEKPELDMMLRLVGDQSTILDIGANVGWYSIALAKAYPSARILAFEPIPSTYRQLQENIRINDVHNVKIHNFGLSDRIDTLTFYFYPECSGNASLANLTSSQGVEVLSCPVRTLDDFATEGDVTVDFIKCDVEGAELLVFKGGVQMIGRCRPIIFTELLRKWSAKFDYHPNQIIELLAGLGYQCFTVEEGRLTSFFSMDENTVETNFIFLHTAKHASLIALFCHDRKNDVIPVPA
ncbi:MAG: FkbM family methyltransferase [bacterium]